MVSKVARSNKLGLGLLFTGLFTAAVSMGTVGCAYGVADGGAEPTAEEAPPEVAHAGMTDSRELLPIAQPAKSRIEARSQATFTGEPTAAPVVEEPGTGEGNGGGSYSGAGGAAGGQGSGNGASGGWNGVGGNRTQE